MRWHARVLWVLFEVLGMAPSSFVARGVTGFVAGEMLTPSEAIRDRTRRLQNVSQTIEDLLNGYDIRLRPQFGGRPHKS